MPKPYRQRKNFHQNYAVKVKYCSSVQCIATINLRLAGNCQKSRSRKQKSGANVPANRTFGISPNIYWRDRESFDKISSMKTKLGFTRTAAAVPVTRPCDAAGNLKSILRLAEAAEEQECDITVFPELSVTGSTCGDLFLRPALQEAAERSVEKFLSATKTFNCCFVIGAPVSAAGMLFDCAIATCKGRILGIVPKTSPTRSRWFAPASCLPADSTADFAGQKNIPFGPNLLFSKGTAVFTAETGDDFLAPEHQGAALSRLGANIILNPAANPATAGSADYLAKMLEAASRRLNCAYVYTCAGPGESSTDFAFDGLAAIFEAGELCGRSNRFDRTAHITFADIDTGFLRFRRMRNSALRMQSASVPQTKIIEIDEAGNKRHKSPVQGLYRRIDPSPFVPADAFARRKLAEETLAVQSSALATRLLAAGHDRVEVALSGGLDSALALIVCVETFQHLGFDKSGIGVLTLPGFGTSSGTLENARALCRGLGLKLDEINISESCKKHLADIGHDGLKHDTAYENAQARERTQILMDRANMHRALAVGTGDLSELALGWCTFNGDHMSMYGVNASIPKTLVRCITEYAAYKYESLGLAEAAGALRAILSTPVSPELLPSGAKGSISQKTEDILGPYEVHDFFIWHYMTRGASKQKIALLAEEAFKDKYCKEEIGRWLDTFFRRFFAQQFKRSCSPDGPAAGPVGFSPRGAWVVPSDAVQFEN